MLFVVIDPGEGRIAMAWLVPEPGLRRARADPERTGASGVCGVGEDRHGPVNATQLPSRVLDRLAELDATLG
jgi:hypothetical protein